MVTEVSFDKEVVDPGTDRHLRSSGEEGRCRVPRQIAAEKKPPKDTSSTGVMTDGELRSEQRPEAILVKIDERVSGERKQRHRLCWVLDGLGL
ncbi:hypothetical protein U1Q18_008245 [Sarracenia purpurea var. burkii]